MRDAVIEFNKRALPDLIRRTAFQAKKGKYDQYVPTTKYEALVEYFRMMDKKADIRESRIRQWKERMAF